MSKILIVGGSSGIGLATAKLFQHKGYAVAIGSRNAETMDLPNMEKHNLDFLDDKAVETFFKKNHDFEYIVVTATSPLAFGPFKQVDTITAKKSFDKLWGMVNIIRHASEYCSTLKAITLISGSAADKRGAPLTFPAVGNNAVHCLVESLALELAPLRINAVSPGAADTPLLHSFSVEDIQAFANAVPLKRIASATEIAEAISFVTLHPNMTGSIITCDGGGRL